VAPIPPNMGSPEFGSPELQKWFKRYTSFLENWSYVPLTFRVFEKGKAFEFYPQALCYLPLRAFSFKMNFEGLTLHFSFFLH